LEGKYSNKYHGLTLTQNWSTSNVLRTQVELENQIAKGLKIDTTTTLNPDKNSKAVTLGAAFKQPGLHTRTLLDVFNVRAPALSLLLRTGLRSPAPQGPTLTTDAVVGRDGFLLGAEASYNVTEGSITRYAAAFGFSAPDYAVTLQGLSNFRTIAASYYHRVSPDVEAGAKAIYDAKATSPAVALEVGTKLYVAFIFSKLFPRA
jgi:voltage-dependent anion channel protein 2